MATETLKPDLGAARSFRELTKRRELRTDPDRQRRVHAAADCFRRRQPNNSGQVSEHPDGARVNHWGHEFDWSPNFREKRLCCEYAYALGVNLKHHCRGTEHIAVLYNVDRAALRNTLGLQPAEASAFVLASFYP